MGSRPVESHRGVVSAGWLLAASLALLATATAARAGDWPYHQGDRGATARAETQGMISAASGELPGLVQQLRTDKLALEPGLMFDVDMDGISDLVVPLQGRVVAVDGATDAVLWATPIHLFSGLLGIYDLDGDGAREELVAGAEGMTGGVGVIDIYTGGMLWFYGPLTNRSGVDLREVIALDVDDDGAEELFFAEWLYGNPGIHAVDFAGGYGEDGVVEGQLPGGYINLNVAAGGALLGAGEPRAMLVQQLRDFALIEFCPSSDPDASCSADGSLCLCDRGLFEDVHPNFSLGPFFAQDLDGDGTDEVVDLPNASRYGTLIGILDIEQGMAGGTPDTDAAWVWALDYGFGPPDSYMLADDEPLIDLTGDGYPDLVVSLYNDTDLEVDAFGAPADDGIDHPDAFAVAVFDALTGDLHAAIPDAIAWGAADLDADGVAEIVTSPTTGWSYDTGIRGFALDCTPDCVAVEVWYTPDHTLQPDLASLDDAGFPEIGLPLVDIGGDGLLELLAFDDGYIEALSLISGVVVMSSTVLDEDEELFAIDDLGRHLVLGTETELRLLDAELDVINPLLDVAGQSTPDVRAISFDPGDARAALVVDGAVFWTVAAPQSMADADVVAQRNVAFAEDLTGDGYLELVTWSQPTETDDGSLIVDVHSFDPADPDGDGTPFDLLWTFDTGGDPDLAGLAASDTNGHGVRALDRDGDGDAEIVFGTWSSVTGEKALLVLDALTGALEEVIDGSFVPSGRWAPRVPSWVDDVVATDGTPGADGADDLFLADFQRVHVLPGGATTPSASVTTGIWHSQSAVGDLDGDGVVELMLMTNEGTAPEMALFSLEPTPADLWGAVAPVETVPRNGDENVALVDADGDPGLDVAFASGDGSLDVYAGADGALLAGYPLYLSQGAASASQQPDALALSGAVTYDCDGDGFEEVLVAGLDGYVYAVNVSEDELVAPSLEWSAYLGTPIQALRIADVDADGLDEVIVASQDSTVRVLDGTGAWVSIDEPADGDCLPTPTVVVAGSAGVVDAVDVLLAGVVVAGDVPADTGSWETSGVGPPGVGTWQIEVRGKDAAGLVLASDQITVLFDGDKDLDGDTVCGGDCDDTDPDRNLADEDGDGVSTCDDDCDDNDGGVYPGATEVCNGVDDNCDGYVDEGFDADGDGYTTCEDDCDDGDASLDPADRDGDGYSTCDGDCDDADETRHPGAEDICDDGVDQDCDGEDELCDPTDDDDDDDSADPGGDCDCRLDGGSPSAGAAGTVALAALVMLRRTLRRRR